MDVDAERRERLFNPKPLKRTTFPEGYFEKDLHLHFHLRFRPDAEGLEACDYCVVLEYLSSWHFVEPRLDHVDGGLDRNDATHVGLGGEVEFPVLIPVGKRVESGEIVVIGFARSLVRLQLLEKCNVVGLHSTGLASPTFARFFGGVRGGMNAEIEGVFGEDRELRPGGLGVAVVPDDQLPSKMVQGGPRVVDDIPDSGAPSEGRILSDSDAYDILTGLELEFLDGFVGFTLQKLPHGVLERVEMLLSPNEL